MLANAKEILFKAKEGKYAVGAFNASNMETAQGIIMAAVERKSPIIIQITESAMKYAGARELSEIVKIIIQERSENIPIAINLDHGKTMDLVRRAIELGFTEVMIDGSRLSFEDNKNLTKRVVDFAHGEGVPVQAELGIVPYLGEIDTSELNWETLMTDPERAKDFVDYAKVDFLAVAIGNAHGFFREAEKCDWERLNKIRDLINIPLVLHGASDWSKEKTDNAVKGGIACFNVDTDIRLAFMHQLCQTVGGEKCTITDPRKVMDPVRNAIKKKVIEKINIFGSAMKA
jgi:fructose-bisphosphate aldolase, class II